MTAWNDFVKKIYHEGHDSNPNYQFKQALKDASKRKSEMGSASSGHSGKKSTRKSRKACMKSCKRTCSRGKRMRGGTGSNVGNTGIGSNIQNIKPVTTGSTGSTVGTGANIANLKANANLKGGRRTKRRRSHRRH